MFSLFIYMTAAHFLCDYPLQGEWMSKAKNPNSKLVKDDEIWPHVLIGHALIHATAVQLITGSWILFFLELCIHTVTDYAKCMGVIGYSTDQRIHILCKLFYFTLLVFLGWLP